MSSSSSSSLKYLISSQDEDEPPRPTTKSWVEQPDRIASMTMTSWLHELKGNNSNPTIAVLDMEPSVSSASSSLDLREQPIMSSSPHDYRSTTYNTEPYALLRSQVDEAAMLAGWTREPVISRRRRAILPEREKKSRPPQPTVSNSSEESESTFTWSSQQPDTDRTSISSNISLTGLLNELCKQREEGSTIDLASTLIRPASLSPTNPALIRPASVASAFSSSSSGSLSSYETVDSYSTQQLVRVSKIERLSRHSVALRSIAHGDNIATPATTKPDVLSQFPHPPLRTPSVQQFDSLSEMRASSTSCAKCTAHHQCIGPQDMRHRGQTAQCVAPTRASILSPMTFAKVKRQVTFAADVKSTSRECCNFLSTRSVVQRPDHQRSNPAGQSSIRWATV